MAGQYRAILKQLKITVPHKTGQRSTVDWNSVQQHPKTVPHRPYFQTVPCNTFGYQQCAHSPPKQIRNLRSSNCWKCIQIVNPNTTLVLYHFKFFTIPSGRPFCLLGVFDGPWQFCSTHLLGPLPNSRSIIIIVDYYSSFFEAALLKSTKAEKIVAFLYTIFCRYGYPEVLRSDNGPQFISEIFQKYLSNNGVKWLSTTEDSMATSKWFSRESKLVSS